MVYGILRLINFAHGDIYVLGAFMGLYASRWFHAAENPSPVKALLVLLTACCSALIGMLIERLAYKPVRSRRGCPRSSRRSACRCCSRTAACSCSAPIPVLPQLIPQKTIALLPGVAVSNQQLIVLVVHR